jgi:hypothetical protein
VKFNVDLYREVLRIFYMYCLLHLKKVQTNLKNKFKDLTEQILMFH